MRTLLTGVMLLALLPPVASAQERTVTFTVEKMTCALCPITVSRAMKRVEGVVEVSVDYDKKRATVGYDDAITTWEEIAAASAGVGFPANKVE
jgi:mercuric ion binding protein